jgi:membrane-associated phospholipid phosphatase
MRSGSPLIAPSARRWAFALMACCAVLVAGLGVLFAHQTTPDSFDRAVDSPIISWFSGHQGLSSWLAAPGSSIPATVLCAAIVAACLLTGRPNGAVLAAVALPAAVGLDDGVLKNLFDRTYLGYLTYPSGHTTAMFALAATVAVVNLGPLRPARPWPVRMMITAIGCLLGVAVAIGVIGLRWHYFTDTMAGAALGIGTVCGLALALDLAAARIRRPSTTSIRARVPDRSPKCQAGAPVSRRPRLRKDQYLDSVAMKPGPTVPRPVRLSNPAVAVSVTSRVAQLPVPSQ